MSGCSVRTHPSRIFYIHSVFCRPATSCSLMSVLVVGVSSTWRVALQLGQLRSASATTTTTTFGDAGFQDYRDAQFQKSRFIGDATFRTKIGPPNTSRR